MAFLFNKFQEAVRALAKNPVFAADLSYYHLGKNAEEKDEEKDAEEIIDMASKVSVADQQK